MAGSVQPGWYSDPFDPQSVRWWNGAAWTEHQQAKPSRTSEQNRGAQRQAADVPEWGTRDAGHTSGGPNAHPKGLLYGLGAVGVAFALVVHAEEAPRPLIRRWACGVTKPESPVAAFGSGTLHCGDPNSDFIDHALQECRSG